LIDGFWEGLGQDVSNIVIDGYWHNRDFFVLDTIVNVVVLYIEMFQQAMTLGGLCETD